jgi:hypothetical protein
MFRDLRQNPIVARFRASERRRSGSSLRGWLRRQAVPVCIFLGSFGLLALIRVAAHWDNRADWFTQLLAGASLTTCLAVPLMAPFRSLAGTFSAFTGEREARTLDSLLGTRLSATEIAEGKLWTGVWPLLRELALLAPLVLVMGSHECPVQSFVYLGLSLGFVLFFAVLGLWCSVTSRGTQGASRKGMAIACGLMFGAPALACFVERWTGEGSDLSTAGYLLSPLLTSSCLRLEPSQSEVCLALSWLTLGAASVGLWRSTVSRLSRQAESL